MKWVLATKTKRGSTVYVEQMKHGFSTTDKLENATRYEDFKELAEWMRYANDEFHRSVFALQIYNKEGAKKLLNEILEEQRIEPLNDQEFEDNFGKQPDEVTALEIEEVVKDITDDIRLAIAEARQSKREQLEIIRDCEGQL